MEIFLIRHTSVDVPQGICYGQSDVPLKSSFEQEAEIVKKQLDNETFDAVYTSPLSRCVKLSAYCGYPDALRDDRLKEMYMGDWEMRTFNEIEDPRLQEWYDDFLHVPTRNGESYQDLLARVSSFLNELRSSENASGYDKIAIFTHGGVLLCVQSLTGYIHPDNVIQQLPAYGEIVRILLG
ncbi:MAG: alpha-ribazole phosphatase [Tannerella sp.]|jgi:alpha-ribazole phosphatase|nr:alpha-ribazole phosphatase [Tannerella sp.]